MRKLSALLAAAAFTGSLSIVASVPASAETAAAPSSADSAFQSLAQRYISEYAQLNPVDATRLGDHRFDSQLPDVSAEGRARTYAAVTSLLGQLHAIDRAALSKDNQVDAALLENALDQELFRIDVTQSWAWNPQYYNDIASSSLYYMVARDFAPWPQRFEALTARMEALPAFLAESRRQIDPARVPPVHAQTVSRQNAGLIDIVDSAILPQVESSGLPRERFDAAYAKLKTAVAEQQRWLDEVVVPNAKGEFRLGTDLYDRKMRLETMSSMTRPELKARAQQAYEEARNEMEQLARTFPDCATGDQQAVIECALAKTYADRATRGSVEAKARETLAQATAFTQEKGFVRMPSGPVQIITMPKFQQGNAVAYDDPPGPLEKHLPNFFAVSPIPDDWTDEQANSFLAEYNNYMLHELSIHEGVPGHYLQLDHANQNEDVLRAVLFSSTFAEGWAVYSERVMAEQGYLGGDATTEGKLFRLTMLKMRLRSIINTLLDIGIHTEGMTREQAMELMTKGGFQQEREASGKWIRANLSSVQLLSYFTGYAEHMALREEAQRRQGNAFNLRTYHDEVLSHGSPPVKYVRALMFDLPVE